MRVKVLEVDVQRKRIALTMRLDDEAGAQPPRGTVGRDAGGARAAAAPPRRDPPAGGGANAFADAFRKAGLPPKR